MLEDLLDDDPVHFTVAEWRERNFKLYAELHDRRLVDASIVSPAAQEFLTEAMIRDDNPAALDPQNAGHVRAQNENILHYGLLLDAPKDALTIALVAGLIHDLNKAIGIPLRDDRYAPRLSDGQPLDHMRTLAESVGLNHLGEETRQAIHRARRLKRGGLDASVAAALDCVIVHHGLGSSLFIRRLLDGDNDWWGAQLVDRRNGRRKVIHPPQPQAKLQNVLHDLADSTQQMQGGVAWLFKYPSGFWRDSGRSYGAMLSSRGEAPGQGIAMSLRDQLAVETWTCHQIIGQAKLDGLLDDRGSARLVSAVAQATRRTRIWVDDTRTAADAHTVYHDVAKGLGVSLGQARKRLHQSGPGAKGAEALEPLLWASARKQDRRRTRDLARLITSA